LSKLHRITTSDLPLWYLKALLFAIVLSKLHRITASDYPFGIFEFFFSSISKTKFRKW